MKLLGCGWTTGFHPICPALPQERMNIVDNVNLDLPERMNIVENVNLDLPVVT